MARQRRKPEFDRGYCQVWQYPNGQIILNWGWRSSIPIQEMYDRPREGAWFELTAQGNCSHSIRLPSSLIEKTLAQNWDDLRVVPPVVAEEAAVLTRMAEQLRAGTRPEDIFDRADREAAARSAADVDYDDGNLLGGLHHG